jgi:hypothetical protein
VTPKTEAILDPLDTRPTYANPLDMHDPQQDPEESTLPFVTDTFCAAVAISFTILLLQDVLTYI